MSKLEGFEFQIDLPGQGTVAVGGSTEPPQNDPPASNNEPVVTADEPVVSNDPQLNPPVAEPLKAVEATPYDLLTQDPFMGSLINKYAAGEDYLEDLRKELDRITELQADYSTVADEDIIRKALERDNPNMKGKLLDKLYEHYMSQHYPMPELDEDEMPDEDAMEFRAALIKQDADRRRAALESSKASLKREPIVNIKEEQTKKQAEEAKRREAEDAAWKESVRNNPFVSKVLQTGTVTVSKGDTTVEYAIPDKAKYEAALLDWNAFYGNLLNADGTENHEKWAKIVAFALNPEAYDNTLISVSKGQGSNAVLDVIQNPSKKADAPAPPAPESLAEALIKSLNRK